MELDIDPCRLARAEPACPAPWPRSRAVTGPSGGVAATPSGGAGKLCFGGSAVVAGITAPTSVGRRLDATRWLLLAIRSWADILGPTSALVVGGDPPAARQRDEREEMKTMSKGSGAPVRLTYQKIRDVSTKAEEQNSAATYIAVIPAVEILKIGTEGNLRDYIPSHPGKKRNQVHKAIGDTIRNSPDRFPQFNSGFLVGASKIKIDDSAKTVSIWDASVNNGAQTQGEIELYLQECEEEGEDPNEVSARLEISVEPDRAVRTEIAIARNTMTRIQDISQAGRRGYFKDLNAAFRKRHPGLELATSETDLGDQFVNTRLLLQVLRVMMPDELQPGDRPSIEMRMRGYKNAALCLTDFEATYLERKTSEAEVKRYQYYCDMAGDAWSIYCKWRKHAAWEGKYLRSDANQAERRDGEIIQVADGLIFPILAALSNFVKRDRKSGTWALKVPPVFKEERLAEAARRQLQQHAGKPMLMGRSGAAYEALMFLTEMAEAFAEA
jgi:AIPR protein